MFKGLLKDRRVRLNQRRRCMSLYADNRIPSIHVHNYIDNCLDSALQDPKSSEYFVRF